MAASGANTRHSRASVSLCGRVLPQPSSCAVVGVDAQLCVLGWWHRVGAGGISAHPPPHSIHVRRKLPRVQWLLSALLCLCWQRVTPRPCCPPCHSYPGTPVLLWGGGHIPQEQLNPPLSLPRNSSTPILEQPPPYGRAGGWGGASRVENFDIAVSRGAAGPPKPDINPHEHPGPQEEARSRGRRDRAVTLSSCCSPAHRLCSVTQHSLTAPSPTAAASSPSPGGTHAPLLPPALPQPQSHPGLHSALSVPTPGPPAAPAAPAQAGTPPPGVNRGCERWRAGWGAVCKHPSPLLCPRIHQDLALPTQSPVWDQGS